MADLIGIAGGALSAGINPHGAELTSLRDAAGRELMTDADPAFWTGHAPILFPIVGAAQGGMIRIDGTAYPMPKHGLARRSDFDLVERDAARAVFRLTDSAETRASYPFAFVLDIGFAIDRATLSIEARIGNPGDAPLPASFGFHPAFAWPLPDGGERAAHRIVFSREEPAALREIGGDGLVLPTPRPSPLDRRTLPLADALFERDALVWDELASDRVGYGAPGYASLEIAFPDTPRLGIWTKPGARFVCIEPWHGIADPKGFAGDFRAKPGVFEVPPGGEKRIAMSVTLTA